MGCSVSFCPMNRHSKSIVIFVCSVLLFIPACGQQQQKPAAMAEHAVLEQLAEAYNAVGEQYPMQPQAMPPKGRKEFLQQVFAQAGYDYSATLTALAQASVNKANSNQSDLAELLLLPGRGFSDADLESVFSTDELVAVKKLRATFR